ncbi:sensor histidine kinase [Sphingobacterium sp. LRF_L2]|uniref:sensor histidine kinase n=1 Tax=Sphingobacterium sp. LRF_L2 TaxID=3369421 RepID=UPI003F5F7845
MIVSFRKYINIGIHLLGWTLLGFLQLYYIPLTWNVEVPTFFWLWQSCVLLMMIVIFYVNAKLIVPRTIVADKPILFIIWLVLCLLLLQLIAYYYISTTHMHERISKLLGNTFRGERVFDNFVFTVTLLVLALSTGWAMLTHWQKAAQRERALERDKMMTELALLKMQINPHFFFNSLNSVYSLTYIDVEDSRKALLTLSRMMRYLLYNTEEEMTSLSKDVDFLKDYVSIMQLRATKKVSIDFQIPDLLIDYPIAPMLLLPFIENAFKHGVDATANGKIAIHLSQQEGRITLSVMNTVFEQRTPLLAGEGGVGLTNTQRRLQLLYPDRYLLQTGINKDGKYEVLLTIDLAS